MAETTTRTAGVIDTAPPLTTLAILAPAIGWLVPGAGHFIQRRWIRGLLLMSSVVILFVLGACGNALAMLCYVRTDPIYPFVMSIIVVFMLVFALLSIVLIATGCWASSARHWMPS